MSVGATASTKRRTGFSRRPVIRRGAEKAVPPRLLTPQDIEILKALAKRRFLSIDYIAALVGTSFRYATARTQILKSQPNCYIKVCDEQAQNPRAHLHTPLFFELDGPGITELAERGIHLPPRKPVRNFRHQVMVDQIMASADIGTGEHDLTVLSRADILADERTPERTRRAPYPDRLPVTKDRSLRPDGEMFVLKGDAFYFLPGIEADTGSEPIHTYDRERTSIHQKFADYLQIIENETYRTHFGARTFFVPFITTTTRRMQSMMALLEEMTVKRPAHRKCFLFKTHPLYTSSKRAEPTGHFVTEAWQRVGYPPLSFLGETGEVQ